MGNERIGVDGLDDLGGRLEGGVYVAVGAHGVDGRRLEQLGGLLLEAVTALGGAGAEVPLDLEAFAGGLRLPPGVGDDGHAGLHSRLRRGERTQLEGAVDDQHVAHAGELAYLFDVGAFYLAAVDWALLNDSRQHAGQRDVNAEEIGSAS